MEQETKVVAQARALSEAVGTGIPAAMIAEISAFASDATPTKFFRDHQDVPFWFEKLEKVGWESRVGKIADLWAENDGNIQRATDLTGRPKKVPDRALVRAFGIYRFKQVSAEQWKPLYQGPGMDAKLQTVVCIALEDLGPANGFLFDLRHGMDLCMDGGSTLLLPPSGGGKGIIIWLDL